MKSFAFAGAAIVALLIPVAASADDPRDPSMRNAAARARDKEIVRHLNLAENDAVVKRGVRWHVVGANPADDADYTAMSRDHDQAVADYARDRAQYARDMADWRRTVAACRAGDYSACDN